MAESQKKFKLPHFTPKLFAIDMDGTLLNHEHQVSKLTTQALQRLVDLKIPYVVATGRHYRDVAPYLEKMPGNSPLICCNGGALWHRGEDRFTYLFELPRDVVGIIMKKAMELDCAVFISFENGRVYSEEWNSHFGRKFCDKLNIFQHVEPGAMKVLQSSEFQTLKPYKMSCIGTHEQLLDVKKFVTEMSYSTSTIHHHPELKNPAVKPAFGLPQLLDIQPHGLSKATTLKSVCDALGIFMEEVVGIGDGMNDEELIRDTGFGYAMMNGNSQLKDLASEVLPSNREDGVAQLIFLLFGKE